MSLWQEFKTFAMRGNVMDMAVGIIIGAAFGKIVNSLVSDILMPPIGILLGKMDFSQMSLVLREATKDAAGKEVAAVTLGYGMFINTIVNFLIVAVAVFAMVKVMNMAKKKEEAKPTPPPAPTKEELLLTEIRDILKSK